MRLWHKDLIPVLPRQQLLGQWRECCLIVKSIAEDGTPNHLLVNKIMDYPMDHFYTYCQMVYSEMIERGYNCDFNKFTKWYRQIDNAQEIIVARQHLFSKWHTNRYYKQCYFNLQEKFDCEGISPNEFKEIIRDKNRRMI